MVRPAGEILQVIGGYGFHIYDDSGAPWITISYRTEDAARKARDLIARIKIIAAGELLDRSLRSLYSSSDGVRGLGAAVKNLSHRASPECSISMADSTTLRDCTPRVEGRRMTAGLAIAAASLRTPCRRPPPQSARGHRADAMHAQSFAPRSRCRPAGAAAW